MELLCIRLYSTRSLFKSLIGFKHTFFDQKCYIAKIIVRNIVTILSSISKGLHLAYYLGLGRFAVF